jgi:hypothetical protein
VGSTLREVEVLGLQGVGAATVIVGGALIYIALGFGSPARIFVGLLVGFLTFRGAFRRSPDAS